MNEESKIKQAQGYSGVGQNPNSNLRRAEQRKSLLSQEKAFALQQSSLRLRAMPLNSYEGSSTGVHSDVRTIIEHLQFVGRRNFVATVFTSTIVPSRFIRVGSGPSATWKVVFTQAKLWEQSLHTTGLGHSIQAGSGFLDDEPGPEIALSAGLNEVWLKFGLSKAGKVAPDSAALTIGAEPETTQLEPVRPPVPDDALTESGVDGIHTQLVGILEVKPDNTVEWQPVCPSAKVDIFLPGIEFVGDGQRLWKEYNAEEGTDRWRTIKNAGEPSSGVAGDSVTFLLEPETPGDPIGDSLVIARLAQKFDEPQVKVERLGSGMTAINIVKGNGKNGKRILLDPEGNLAWDIEWKDGLVVSEGEESYQDQIGGDGSGSNSSNL